MLLQEMVGLCSVKEDNRNMKVLHEAHSTTEFCMVCVRLSGERFGNFQRHTTKLCREVNLERQQDENVPNPILLKLF